MQEQQNHRNEPDPFTATDSTELQDLAQLATMTPPVLGGLAKVLTDHGAPLRTLQVRYDLELRTVVFTAEVCDCEDEEDDAEELAGSTMTTD